MAQWATSGAWHPFENWRGVAGTLKAHWHAGARVALVQGYIAGPITYYLPE